MSKLIELTNIRDSLFASFNTGKTRSYEYRMSQLRGVKRFLETESDALVKALNMDLHRPPFEADALELGCLMADLNHIMDNLKTWMKPELTPVPAVFAPAQSEIHHDPFGVCFIICPFNYPIILAVSFLFSFLFLL
jgi:aldehyde dehydrogenase (NAD+)